MDIAHILNSYSNGLIFEKWNTISYINKNYGINVTGIQHVDDLHTKA